MLVVLIGGTLKVAKDSRAYFINKGFDIVEKQLHRPTDGLLPRLSIFPKTYTKEEIEECDFVSEK